MQMSLKMWYYTSIMNRIFVKRLKNGQFRNILILIIAVLIFCLGGTFLWLSTLKIPTLEALTQNQIAQSTKIYDKTGEVVLYDVYQNIKRTVVPFDKISKNLKNATLAIEDKDFYTHKGIKITSTLRAILFDILTLNKAQGGSTITQQLIKNAVLTRDKSIARKLKEWYLAIKLEKEMSKDEIFHLYLNTIPYGGNIYGVEEASNAFYGKKAVDLTITESAYIASLAQAPTYYSPYGKNKTKLDERKNLVLSEMLNDNYITQEEYTSALAEKITFKPRKDTGIKAPHFVIFIKKQLEEKYGQDVLEQGGLKVTTTIDYNLQKKAEELANQYALSNKKNFNAENLALVAIDPKTGQILAMVGSRDFSDEEIDGQFNVATAYRQPGSAFKPFAYAEAFNKGFTPDTVLFDLKTQFSTNCTADNLTSDNGCYSPDNYDNIFRGPVSLRNALAQSINIPAIKTFYLAGTGDTLKLAKDMGISNLKNFNQYGLTLVLGGGEVSLLDMTSAYSVFANNGIRNPYQSIIEIKDKEGKTLEKTENVPTQVLPEETALKITDILSDNNARIPLYGANSPLYFPGKDVAAKTGTTNDYKDAWIIGYAPNITVGAWAGNNDNSPMEKKVSGMIVAPFWNAFMQEALKTIPDERFKKPQIENSYDLKPVLRGKWQGGISYLIDKVSGKRATDFTPVEMLEERVIGGIHSILYWVNKNDVRGAVPQNPSSDAQFNLWEQPVRQWQASTGMQEPGIETIPTQFDDIHTQEYAPQVTIVNPTIQNIYDRNSKVSILINTNGRFPITKAEYFINDNLIGNSTESPFSYSFIPNEFDNIGIENKLKVIVYDSAMNKGQTETLFGITENQ